MGAGKPLNFPALSHPMLRVAMPRYARYIDRTERNFRIPTQNARTLWQACALCFPEAVTGERTFRRLAKHYQASYYYKLSGS